MVDIHIKYICHVISNGDPHAKSPRGEGRHLYFGVDIILVKGLSKHTQARIFLVWKYTLIPGPNYAFLHGFFFLFFSSCPFSNL